MYRLDITALIQKIAIPVFGAALLFVVIPRSGFAAESAKEKERKAFCAAYQKNGRASCFSQTGIQNVVQKIGQFCSESRDSTYEAEQKIAQISLQSQALLLKSKQNMNMDLSKSGSSSTQITPMCNLKKSNDETIRETKRLSAVLNAERKRLEKINETITKNTEYFIKRKQDAKQRAQEFLKGRSREIAYCLDTNTSVLIQDLTNLSQKRLKQLFATLTKEVNDLDNTAQALESGNHSLVRSITSLQTSKKGCSAVSAADITAAELDLKNPKPAPASIAGGGTSATQTGSGVSESKASGNRITKASDYAAGLAVSSGKPKKGSMATMTGDILSEVGSPDDAMATGPTEKTAEGSKKNEEPSVWTFIRDTVKGDEKATGAWKDAAAERAEDAKNVGKFLADGESYEAMGKNAVTLGKNVAEGAKYVATDEEFHNKVTSTVSEHSKYAKGFVGELITGEGESRQGIADSARNLHQKAVDATVSGAESIRDGKLDLGKVADKTGELAKDILVKPAESYIDNMAKLGSKEMDGKEAAITMGKAGLAATEVVGTVTGTTVLTKTGMKAGARMLESEAADAAFTTTTKAAVDAEKLVIRNSEVNTVGKHGSQFAEMGDQAHVAPGAKNVAETNGLGDCVALGMCGPKGSSVAHLTDSQMRNPSALQKTIQSMDESVGGATDAHIRPGVAHLNVGPDGKLRGPSLVTQEGHGAENLRALEQSVQENAPSAKIVQHDPGRDFALKGDGSVQLERNRAIDSLKMEADPAASKSPNSGLSQQAQKIADNPQARDVPEARPQRQIADEYRDAVRRNSQIEDMEVRTSRAAVEVGADPTDPKFRSALDRAHNDISCPVGRCTNAELAAKSKILQTEGGLSKDQAHELIRKGYAGSANPDLGKVYTKSIDDMVAESKQLHAQDQRFQFDSVKPVAAAEQSGVMNQGISVATKGDKEYIVKGLSDDSKLVLDEARNAKAMHELGIGPEANLLATKSGGHSLVMERAPGVNLKEVLNPAKRNEGTKRAIEQTLGIQTSSVDEAAAIFAKEVSNNPEVVAKMRRTGKVLGDNGYITDDFQMMVDPRSGSVQVIDAAAFQKKASASVKPIGDVQEMVHEMDKIGKNAPAARPAPARATSADDIGDLDFTSTRAPASTAPGITAESVKQGSTVSLNGRSVTLGRKLGDGSNGAVFEIQGTNEVVKVPLTRSNVEALKQEIAATERVKQSGIPTLDIKDSLTQADGAYIVKPKIQNIDDLTADAVKYKQGGKYTPEQQASLNDIYNKMKQNKLNLDLNPSNLIWDAKSKQFVLIENGAPMAGKTESKYWQSRDNFDKRYFDSN